jgi:3'(2'), 5'-bisphosphate nucleotidase
MMLNERALAELLPEVIEVAKAVHPLILEIYQNTALWQVETKADHTPVTAADKAAHHHLESALRKLGALPVISEEGGGEFTEDCAQYWLIDPVDGTKEFLNQTGEFTINIALIQNQYPVLGVISQPTTDVVYAACRGQGSQKYTSTTPPQALRVNSIIRAPYRLLISRNHHAPYLSSRLFKTEVSHELVRCGSALKFGLIAEGRGDIYLRRGPTSLWDVAAGQCICEQAGGFVSSWDGKPLTYDLRQLTNPPFIAYGDKAVLQQLVHQPS